MLENQYPKLTQEMLDAIAVAMDDDLLEELHSAEDWKHPGEFLTAYVNMEPNFPIHQCQIE